MIIFAKIMESEKVQIKTTVDLKLYDLLANESLRRGLTVAAFNRYILKKYFNDHAKKTNTNP